MSLEPITIVCGLPRSGTSLMMQILDAAGIRCAGEYPAFEPAELLTGVTSEFIESNVGGAFKLLDPHLHSLPTGKNYRFIMMTRSRRQQSISMVKMMRLTQSVRPGPISGQTMEAMRNNIAIEEAEAIGAISLHGAPILKVRFEDIIERTTPTVWRIADFLNNWSEPEMAAVVKPRSAVCYNGMLEVELVAEREARDAAEKLAPFDPLQCQCHLPPYPCPCTYCEHGEYDRTTV
ncbi:hypothetical protein JIN84_17990 [Luteolibacter yonseiensis]|uniref:Sulfotransferase family protein n=1 Tax=Luteolibacter yonseiensis TaxID=1144680 RepID=A0A934R705_9BACT|nr:hypothetical protein [Luteolibacter yonseiensis]MBK1817517.1 hypothetical protein [Luteolibacter yonseiensis]